MAGLAGTITSRREEIVLKTSRSAGLRRQRSCDGAPLRGQSTGWTHGRLESRRVVRLEAGGGLVALYGPTAVRAPRFPLHRHTIGNVSQSASYCGLVRLPPGSETLT